MNEHLDPEVIRERSQQIDRLLKLRRSGQTQPEGSESDPYTPIIEDWFKVLLAAQLEQQAYDVVANRLQELVSQGDDPFVVLLAEKMQHQAEVQKTLHQETRQLVRQLDLLNFEGASHQALVAVQNQLSQLSKIAVASLLG